MTLFSQNSLPTKSQQEMRFLNVNNVFGVHESNVIEILQCLKSFRQQSVHQLYCYSLLHIQTAICPSVILLQPSSHSDSNLSISYIAIAYFTFRQQSVHQLYCYNLLHIQTTICPSVILLQPTSLSDSNLSISYIAIAYFTFRQQYVHQLYCYITLHIQTAICPSVILLQPTSHSDSNLSISYIAIAYFMKTTVHSLLCCQRFNSEIKTRQKYLLYMWSYIYAWDGVLYLYSCFVLCRLLH